MLNEVWYEMHTPSTQRPFFVKKKDNIVSWSAPRDSIILEPPDGLYVQPPCSDISLDEDPFASAIERAEQYRIGELTSISAKAPLPKDILSLPDQNYDEMLDIPYFPDDLFILPRRDGVLKYLEENTLPQYKGTLGKKELSLEERIRPGKTSLSGPLFKSRPLSPKKPCQLLFKAIYGYITTAGENYLIDFINLIDGNRLADEASYELITEVNSVETKNSIINSWNLLLFVGAKYMVSNEIRKLVRSFSLVTACSKGVDPEIKELARLCLVRFSSTSVISFGEMKLKEQMRQCTSMTALFRFSLCEMIWKEERRGIKHENYVPQILEKMVLRLRDLKAFDYEGIFRKPGMKTERESIVKRVNDGDWDICSPKIDTVASCIVYFFSRMRDSVIPSDMITKTPADAPSYVSIANANSLPPARHDTLKFFVGFIQELVKYEKNTKMTLKNLVISFGLMLSNIPAPVAVEEIKNHPPTLALQKMFTNLVNFWNTSDVYQPINK